MKRDTANRKQSDFFLSVIVLNWNRENLLRGTILSLIATTKFPYELIIIDNGSTDGSAFWLKILESRFPQVKLILLKKNQGGEAINAGFKIARGDLILISENDLEYSPGWDLSMVNAFRAFPELGQLSPLSPYPRREIGENWVDKPGILMSRNGVSIYTTTENVGTSCMIRKEVVRKGVRWHNIRSSKNNFRFPADGPFSRDIRSLGYTIAWSQEYQVINWGHMETTWRSDGKYYSANWNAKSEYNIDGLKDFKQDAKKKSAGDASVEIVHMKLLQEIHALKTKNGIVTRAEMDMKISEIMHSKEYRIGRAVLFPFKPFSIFLHKAVKFLRILRNRNQGI